MPKTGGTAVPKSENASIQLDVISINITIGAISQLVVVLT
jgi:hypothetical protein